MKLTKLFVTIAISSLAFVACGQDKKEGKHDNHKAEHKHEKEDKIPEKEATLAMSQDSIDASIIRDIEAEIIKQKIELTAEALSAIGQTQNLLFEIENGKLEDAIKLGKELIGDFEILFAKDPSLALLPVDVVYEKEEVVTDIKTVRAITKEVHKAIENGYYQEARHLLKDLKSEMIINTYLLPTATYPEAIKAATLLLEEKDTIGASIVLKEALSTIVIEQKIIPLPVLNAEQMIIEAASIDAKSHENSKDVLNLLSNADYQLQLAQELGYGKKDKEYKALSEAIEILKQSVEDKKDSQSKFDELKQDIVKFKERLFPQS